MSFTKDEWFPSRLPFGKLKEQLYQEAREDAELRSWLAEEARELAGEMPFYRGTYQTSSIFSILNSLTKWSAHNATSWSRA